MKYFIPHRVRQLFRDEGRKRIAENSIWSLTDRVVRGVVGLAIGIWFARFLGPDEFGIWSWASSVVVIAASLQQLGIEQIAVRNIVRNPDRTPATIGTLVVLWVLASILILCGLAIYSSFFALDRSNLVRYLVIWFSIGNIFLAFDGLDVWFKAHLLSRISIRARLIGFTIASAIKIYLILRHGKLISFAIVTAFESMMNAILLIACFKRNALSLNKLRFSWIEGRSLLKDGWPYIFSSLMISIYMRIDQVMLGNMLGPNQVGNYSVAVRICEVFYLIPMTFVPSVFPSLIRAKEISQELFLQKLQRLYNLMAFLGYVFSVFIFLFGTILVKILFGNQFSGASSILLVSIWGLIFVNLGVARSAFLNVMNWNKTHTSMVISGAVINVLLNFTLIPRFGAIGAAYATLISYAVATYISCFLIKNMHQTAQMLTRAILWPRFW